MCGTVHDKYEWTKGGAKMNPVMALKLKKIAKQFSDAHPKFAEFIKSTYGENMQEGTAVKIIVQTPDGELKSAVMKIKNSDLKLIEEIKKL